MKILFENLDGNNSTIISQRKLVFRSLIFFQIQKHFANFVKIGKKTDVLR